jgi:serine O-acetyltransferase
MSNREVAEKLLESYESDPDELKLDPSVRFPRRNHTFEEVGLLREIFFPNFWGSSHLTQQENKIDLENRLDDLENLFTRGIALKPRDEARTISKSVIAGLPEVRELLKKDAKAAYNGDPAAVEYAPIIRSYPGFHALMIHRASHLLNNEGARTYAEELSEHAHSVTGIDIDQGAQIGEYFFIDHGTGVVIGETCKIGNHVRVYQGVTLGGKRFEEDEEGVLIKGEKRHPDIGDHTTIYANALILGPVKIGKHVTIGGNTWIEKDVPDYTTVYVKEHPTQEHKEMS